MEQIHSFLKPITNIINGTATAVDIWSLVLRLGMLISIFCFVTLSILYIKNYRILEGLLAKLKGDVQAYDRIRRSQMRMQMEENNAAFHKKEYKHSLLNKIYSTVAYAGITEKIPGFSEIGLIITLITIAFFIFIILTFTKAILTGVLASGAFLIISWYTLDLIAYNRKIKLEKQLLQFTNACASASLQFSNIIDIFGMVYDQFSSPLREGLEACYVEAKKTNDKVTALKHLKNRYNSTQFAFIIDNFELCSSVTGDYHATAEDVSETIAIYSASHEKKRVLLRNAKINIMAMFAISLGILYALSIFVGDISTIMLDTAVGNVLTVALILIFFYGLNIKTDK